MKCAFLSGVLNRTSIISKYDNKRLPTNIINMIAVSLRSKEISARRIFDKTYFALTGTSDVIIAAAAAPTDETIQTPFPSKPILTQIRDLLESTLSRGGLVREKRNGDAVAADGEEPVHRLQLPTNTEIFVNRFANTAIPLQYDVLEHVVKDVQLQLSYLIAKGIAVWSLKPEDIYAVEVSPDNWRYVLLTEYLSGSGGSTDALIEFLRQYVTPKWESTKLYTYLRRIELHADATWI